MTDVHPSPSPDHTPIHQTSVDTGASGLGWPTSFATDISIEVSRETSMITAGLGWPE